MTYLERKFVFTVILFAATMEVIGAAVVAGVHLASGRGVPVTQALSLASPLALGGLAAAMSAVYLSTAFVRSNILVDLMWTRPISRTKLACAIMAVDLGGIFAIWFGSFVIIGVVPLWVAGVVPASLRFDAQALQVFVATAASLVALYGLGTAFSCAFRMQTRTLGWDAARLGFGSSMLAMLFMIPMSQVILVDLALLFGNADEVQYILRAPTFLHPLWLPDPSAGTLLVVCAGAAALAATPYLWRRAQF